MPIFTRPTIEIRTKTHLLEFSTVTHVVKNKIKWVIIYKKNGSRGSKSDEMYTSQQATA